METNSSNKNKPKIGYSECVAMIIKETINIKKKNVASFSKRIVLLS